MRGQLGETSQHRGFEQAWLIGRVDQARGLVEKGKACSKLGLDRRGIAASSASTLQLGPQSIGLHGFAYVAEARCDDVELPIVEFSRLDQHLLAHADFAEVMQHARVL